MSGRTEKQTGNGGGKAAATRLRLLDAAARVLSEQGYANTRLTDVGELAGVQGTAIYYHFSNKEDLVAEVFREGLVHARRYVLDALAEADPADPIERLSVAIDAHLRLSTVRPHFSAAASRRSSGEVPPAVQAHCRLDERAYAQIWKTLLLEAQRAGVLHENLHLGTVQIMLLNALNSLNYSLSPRRPDIEIAVKSAQRLILNGICKDEVASPTKVARSRSSNGS